MVCGFLADGQGVLVAADIGQAGAQVVEGGGQVGEEGVGARLGEGAVVAVGFLYGGEGVLVAAQCGQPVGVTPAPQPHPRTAARR